MSISTQLERIRTDKSKIRNKLVAMGLATTTDNLDKLATAVEGITNHTNIQAEVLEGSTYTIPKGYHNGSGVVIAKTDVEGDYSRYVLQAKTGIIPSEQQQTITSDEGNYGLSSVTVEPIPSNYKDISNVTAAASHVLAGKIFVNGSGVETTGTMPNKGAVEVVLDDTKNANGQLTNRSYTITAGYHNGNGTVRVGDSMHDTSDVNASSGTVLKGSYFVNSAGETIQGTIETKTDANLSASGKTVSVPAGYYAKAYTKDVGTTSIAKPTISVAADGTITASVSQTTPGYIASGVSNSNTLTLSSTHDTDFKAANIRDGVTIFGVEGTFTDDATVTTTGSAGKLESPDMLSGKTAYAQGFKVTGTIPTKTSTDLSASNLTITVPAGYYASNVTKTLSDTDLAAGNIRKGFNIFGVDGTFTSDATAVAANILNTKTAYVNGSKVTGTMTNHGVVEGIEIDVLSNTPYYERTFSGYVDAVSVGISSSLETALAEI